MIFLLINLVVSLDIHLTPDTELSMSLPAIISPSNFSCSISGFFNISTSQHPTLQGGLSQISIFPYPLSETPSVSSIFGKTLYSGSRKLSLFNISTLSNISQIIDLDIGESPILVVQPVGNLLITAETTGLFRVTNMTTGTEIKSLQLNSSLESPISCIFLQDLDFWWAFIYNSSSMIVVKFELNKVFNSSVFKTLNLSSFEFCSGLMMVNVMRSIFYICDVENGILTYDLSPVIYTPNGQPSFISNFRHPLYFGKVSQCTLNQQTLTVSTDQALIVYQIPFLAVLRVFSGSFGPAVTSAELTVAFTYDRLQVFNNSLESVQVALADDFVKAKSWVLTSGFIITIDEENIVVYSFLNPFVTFHKQRKNYEYQGIVKCGNSVQNLKVLGSYSSGIFSYRGDSEGSGFEQPESFNNYTYGDPFQILLPISNYFSGNNLTYSIFSEKGSVDIVPFEKKVFSFNFIEEGRNKLIQGNNVIIATDKRVYSVVLNSNFKLNYSGIIVKSSDVQRITCVSLLNGLVFIEYLNENQKNIQEILTVTGKVLYSESISNENLCDDLLIFNNFAIILRSFCIETYNTTENQFKLMKILCLSGESIEISQCVSLCVLINNTVLYQYSVDLLSSQLIFEFPEAVNEILSSVGFLVAVSDSTIFKFELPNFNVFQFPVLCVTSSYSISGQFLSSYCEDLYIFDLHSPCFSSIIERNTYFGNIILDPSSSFPSFGMIFVGKNFEIYSLGNNLSSKLIPQGSKVSSIWAVLNISTNLSAVEDQVIITAQYQNELLNKSIKITIWNTQFLEKNPEYNPNSSRLTSGSIDLNNHNFAAVIPQNSFIGNNVSFTLKIDGKTLKPSNDCSKVKEYCVEQKYLKLSSLKSDLSISDFFINEEVLITSVGPMINFYNRSTLTELKSFKVMDSFKRIFQCLNLVLLSNNSVVCASVYSSSGLAMYYILLISSDGLVQDSYQIYYQAHWLMVSETKEVHVYVYDGFGLYCFKNVNEKIEFINYYSSASFGTAFYPVSAEYYNESAVIIGDKSLGVCLIIQGQLVQLVSNPYNSSLTDFFLLNSTVLMLTDLGEGYMVSLESLSILKHYYKLYPSGYIPGNMQSALSTRLNLLTYPIYTDENSGFLRVLNYETGQIYTDIYISSFKPYSFFRRIVLIEDPLPKIYHDLAVVGGSVTLQVLVIRAEIKVFLKSLEKNDGVLRLSAWVGENSLEFPEVLLKYPSSDSESSDSSSSNIASEWWFWVALCGGLLLVISIVLGVIFLLKRLKTRKSSGSEPLVINF